MQAGDVEVEGPEYETLSVAGSNCGIGNLNAVMKFNALCDDLGLDTISTGGVAAFAMELQNEVFMTLDCPLVILKDILLFQVKLLKVLVSVRI